MNPDTPLTPREEIEVRLTALLMGELSPEEAAALEALMAADPELTALHARLRRAVELLREASAIPEQPAPPVPARLSSERRERLLAHFKTVVAPTAATRPRRDWSWVVPLGLAAALIALIGGAMPVFYSVQRKGAFVASPDYAADAGLVNSERQREQWGFQLGASRYAASTPAPASERAGGGAGRSDLSGTVTLAGEIKLPAAGAGRGYVSAGENPAAGKEITMNTARLGIPPESDSPAPAQPASPILGRVDSYPDYAGKDGSSKRAPSRVPVLGDIPANERLSASSAAPESRTGVPGRQSVAKPANAALAEDPRVADMQSQLAKSEAELAEAKQVSERLSRGEKATLSAEEEKKRSIFDVNGLVANGANTFSGGTTFAGGTLRIDNQGKSRASGSAEGNVKASKNGRFENQAGLDSAAAAFPMTPTTPTASETRRSPFALGDESKSGQGRIDYGSPIPAYADSVATAATASTAPAQEQMAQFYRRSVNADDGGLPKSKVAPADKPVNGEKKSQALDELAARAKPAPKKAQKEVSVVDELTAKPMENQIRQQAPPDSLRDMAIASLTDEKTRDLLAKRGYLVNQPAAPAPGVGGAPAPATTPAAEPMEVAKLETPKLLIKEANKAKNEEEGLAERPAPPAAIPQPEVQTSVNAFSTFSLNVSDVSFKLAAASLEQGQMPDPSSVRSEEFVNAFDYRDPEPAGDASLACTTERARYPFAQNRDLLRCSVKTAAAGRQPGRALNLVLLLDNSGSMERADRVRIVREALRVLSAQLQPQDKLSVVTFARTPRLWADGVAGNKAAEVTARCSEITPQGGTNIDAALDLGYATALRHYQVGSINRVVLLTDGAANLGDVNPDALKQKVEAHRKQGVALDCFGIGWEGLNDDLLEQLSRNGDGRYGFINSPEEAATEFAGQLAGALRVAASDVKVQVEFNPRRVTAYRQIGYAKHQLKKEQFRDNTVDAAEIGAAESGNALYVCEVNPRGEGDLATVRVRFKVPGTSDYKEHEWAVPFTREAAPLEQASPALRLAGTAAAFAEWLVASPYATEVTPDRLLGLINGVPAIYGADPRPKKLEWMIRQAKSVSGR